MNVPNAPSEHNSRPHRAPNKTAGLESTHTKGNVPNVGTGPAPAIADGGIPGEEKQPKENTGNMTEMGGATGGTSELDLEKHEA